MGSNHYARREQEANKLLEGEDPVRQVVRAMQAFGYGGLPRVPFLVYLAATTRVLKMPRGRMPAHIALSGTTGAGKNYAIDTALAFLPKEVRYEIDAGSPRALIYDPEAQNLRHRVFVCREADSLPKSEDNPAASAIRNLLQDGYLHYKVVEKVEGSHETRAIKIKGPTVLVTTTTKQLPPQMSSRLFYVEVPETRKQIRKALAVHGAMYAGEIVVAKPPKRLIRYQAILQESAPWKVVVPFARLLGEYIGDSPSEPRVMRDYHRLMALIQAVAVLRFWQRQRDPQGRLIAEIPDYAVVWNLMHDAYAATATGAGKNVRQVVEGVAELRKRYKKPVPITVTAVAKHLHLNKMTALRYVRKSLAGGWLMNRADRSHGHSYDLDLGESLPKDQGMPSPKALKRMIQAGGLGER